jgi:hypothetical protein
MLLFLKNKTQSFYNGLTLLLGKLPVVPPSPVGSIPEDLYIPTPANVFDGTIYLSGIESSEIVGSQAIKATVVESGISTQETVGLQNILAKIIANGVATLESVGSQVLKSTFNLLGIVSAESVGTQGIKATVSESGIVSQESMGQQTVSVDVPSTTIHLLGIESAEAFGSLTVEPTSIVKEVMMGWGGGYGRMGATPRLIRLKGIASQESIGNVKIDLGIKPEVKGDKTIDDILRNEDEDILTLFAMME